MSQPIELDVVRDFECLRELLKQSVSEACDNATVVKSYEEFVDIRYSTIDTPELDHLGNSWFVLDWENSPNAVYVDQSHTYPLLLMLACRQLLKANWLVTDIELDSLEFQQHCARYYQETLEKHTEHEFQHYSGALERTSLKCRFGIIFFRTPNKGIQFVPSIDFQGRVETTIFLEKIVKKPGKLSKGDRRYLQNIKEQHAPNL